MFNSLVETQKGNLTGEDMIFVDRSYLILNIILDDSEINRTSSAELHEYSECNSSELVRFIYELS